MRRMYRTGLLLASCLLSWSVEAAERVALVVGNSSYQRSPLVNPKHDATDVAAALRRLQFQVTEVHDVDREQLLQHLHDFSAQIQPGGLALFFFAGHAVEINGKNWLLPVSNGVISTQVQVGMHSVDAGDVLRTMEEREARLSMLVLDSCRDNPLPAGARSGKRGLQEIAVSSATASLVAYSTAPGMTASDGEGGARNSPFTAALLRALSAESVAIPDLFARAGAEVKETTGGAQIPWTSNTPIWPSIMLAGGASTANLGATVESAPPIRTTEALVAPAPPPVVPAGYAAIGAGRLRDGRSGLVWTQADNGRNFDWHEANDWCTGRGMRLPTIEELVALSRSPESREGMCGTFRCMMPPDFKLTSYRLWSSTRLRSTAKSLYVGDGVPQDDRLDESSGGRVLCVASG